MKILALIHSLTHLACLGQALVARNPDTARAGASTTVSSPTPVLGVVHAVSHTLATRVRLTGAKIETPSASIPEGSNGGPESRSLHKRRVESTEDAACRKTTTVWEVETVTELTTTTCALGTECVSRGGRLKGGEGRSTVMVTQTLDPTTLSSYTTTWLTVTTPTGTDPLEKKEPKKASQSKRLSTSYSTWVTVTTSTTGEGPVKSKKPGRNHAKTRFTTTWVTLTTSIPKETTKAQPGKETLTVTVTKTLEASESFAQPSTTKREETTPAEGTSSEPLRATSQPETTAKEGPTTEPSSTTPESTKPPEKQQPGTSPSDTTEDATASSSCPTTKPEPTGHVLQPPTENKASVSWVTELTKHFLCDENVRGWSVGPADSILVEDCQRIVDALKARQGFYRAVDWEMMDQYAVLAEWGTCQVGLRRRNGHPKFPVELGKQDLILFLEKAINSTAQECKLPKTGGETVCFWHTDSKIEYIIRNPGEQS